MKATFKARFDANKDKTPPSSAASAMAINFNLAGDLKLRASLTDATFVHGPTLNGLAFTVEKPGSFVIDYDVPKQATFENRYESNQDKVPPSSSTTACTLNFNASRDLKLHASFTEDSFFHGPTIHSLAFAVEKPGAFVIDYDVPKQDVRFQFMNSVKVAQKPLNLTYMHTKYVGKPPAVDNSDDKIPTVNLGRTMLNGTLVLDSANKVSANHVLGSDNVKLKYTYVHGGSTTFEPSCDLKTQTWDFAVTRRVFGDDLVKASYQTANRNLGLEWATSSKIHGSFKLAATFDLRQDLGFPKLAAETTWNMEM